MEPAEVLRRYSVKLLSLPVDQPVFIGLLNQQNLLPGSTENKMTNICMQQTRQAAAQYLVGEIKNSLVVSQDSFDKLILVMKEYKDGDMEKLANEMESAVISSNPSADPGKSTPKKELTGGGSTNEQLTKAFTGLATTDEDEDDVIVEELWSQQELQKKFELMKEPVSLTNLAKDKVNGVLEKVVVLLLTVNNNEALAVRNYLEPFDEHGDVYEFMKCLTFHGKVNHYAIYHIGKFGACPAAVTIIPPGAEVRGGAANVPMMAYESFPNIGAIIGVGVACGVKEKVKMCDVLVSTQVVNYDQGRAQRGRFEQRGTRINASAFLRNLFTQLIKWPNDSIRQRLKDSKMPNPEVKLGIILSGPYLIDDQNFQDVLIEDFAKEAIGIEMEGAYLFAATQETTTNVIIVKGVCDFGDGKKHKKYQPTAALLAADLVHKKLSGLQVADMIKHKKVVNDSHQVSSDNSHHHTPSSAASSAVNAPDPLSVKFSRFVATIEALLKKCHDKLLLKLEQSKRLCLNLTISNNLNVLLFNDEQLQKINACSTFNELFAILRKHWSLLDYSILEEIITTTDLKEAKDELQVFKKSMGSYEGMKIISENIQPEAIFEYITVSVIIDKPYQELTLEDFKKIRDFIFKYLDIKHYTALPHIKYIVGSMRLEWYVLQKAAPHMIKMAQQNEEIFTNNRVVFIMVDQCVVFDYRAKDKTQIKMSGDCQKASKAIQSLFVKLNNLDLDIILLGQLFQAEVITHRQQIDLQSKCVDEFWMIIDGSLRAGYITTFLKLLQVMNASENRTTRDLARQLSEEAGIPIPPPSESEPPEPESGQSKSAATGTSSVKMQSSLSQVKLFISYAWEDTTNNFVIKLKRDLEAAGLQVFLDKHEIYPGDIIQHEVARGMEEADGIIIVYSERYPKSDWCDKELQMAQNRHKKIFPVRRIKSQYKKNVDLAIGGIMYADFIDDDNGYQSSLTLLIKGIERNCVKKT